LKYFFASWKSSQEERSLKLLKSRLESSIEDILINKTDLSEQYVMSTLDSIFYLRGSKRGLKIVSKFLIQANLKSKFGQLTLNINNYKQILNSYGIINFWELELGSNNLNRIQKAQRNLNNLKNVYEQQIKKLKSSDLIPAVEIPKSSSSFRIENHEPYKFLDDSFNNEFNALDEIMVHQFLLTKSETGNLPLLSRWVRNTNNAAFKIFMIKEIGFFNQMECASIIASLLSIETNNDIKLAIIETLSKMNYKQSESHIVACFCSGNSKVRKSIIETVVCFKSKFGLEFLNELFFASDDIQLKNELIIAMKKIRNEYTVEPESIKTQESLFDNNIYRQINFQIS